MKNNRYTNWFFAAVVVAAGFSMAACEDEPDKYCGFMENFLRIISNSLRKQSIRLEVFI